jgi:hypothetical protein
MPTPAGFEILVDKTPLLIKLLESQNAEVRTGTLALMASCLGCAPTLEAVRDAVQSTGEAGIARLSACEKEQMPSLLNWLGVCMPSANFTHSVVDRLTTSKYPLATHILAIVVVASFIWIIREALKGEPFNNDAALLLGALATAFGAIINYYFDSSGMNKTPPQGPSAPK